MHTRTQRPKRMESTQMAPATVLRLTTTMASQANWSMATRRPNHHQRTMQRHQLQVLTIIERMTCMTCPSVSFKAKWKTQTKYQNPNLIAVDRLSKPEQVKFEKQRHQIIQKDDPLTNHNTHITIFFFFNEETNVKQHTVIIYVTHSHAHHHKWQIKRQLMLPFQ